MSVLIPIDAKVTYESGQRRDGASMNSMRSYLMRMHPFLKHMVLSKGMRDLLYNSKLNRRSKRLDLYYPTSAEAQTSSTTEFERYTISPFFLALKRSVDQKNDPKTADLLGEVLKDIEEIRYGKMLQADEECVINGSWSAEVAGRGIEILNSKQGGALVVKLKKPLQKRRRGILGLDKWNASVKFPFKHKVNYLILTAVNEKQKTIATFMGECRVCRSKPIVQGQWLIGRHSRDCESLGATEQLIGDVWRKEKLCQIKEHRLDAVSGSKKQHGKTSSNNTTISTNSTTTTCIPS